jgi:hypothetical protein
VRKDSPRRTEAEADFKTADCNTEKSSFVVSFAVEAGADLENAKGVFLLSILPYMVHDCRPVT